MDQPVLTTRRLLLRPFLVTDSSRVQLLAGSFEVASTTVNIPYPYLDGMAEQWISTHKKMFDNGIGAVFAITILNENALCGSISLLIDTNNNNAELGYWIGVPYWGMGYCTEAAYVILDYGFKTLRLHRIHAFHFSGNLASGRVMQKLGMMHEGHLRQHLRKWGKFEDLELYGILLSEFVSNDQVQR